MRLEFRTRNQYKTTDWPGGKTTELYIEPPGADYGKREFEIRISSATVELLESEFTRLPGFRRELMVLEGEMELKHVGRHLRRMGPWDVDSFLGEWSTASYGAVRDFNLMALTSMETHLSCRCVEAGQELALTGLPNPEGRKQLLAVYVIEGEGRLEGSRLLSDGLCLIHDYQEEPVMLVNEGVNILRVAVCCILK